MQYTVKRTENTWFVSDAASRFIAAIIPDGRGRRAEDEPGKVHASVRPEGEDCLLLNDSVPCRVQTERFRGAPFPSRAIRVDFSWQGMACAVERDCASCYILRAGNTVSSLYLPLFGRGRLETEIPDPFLTLLLTVAAWMDASADLPSV